jgi:hypothetical protein
VLALRLKPIMKNRAMANMVVRKGEQSGSSSLKSDELQPIRTDAAVASLANLGKSPASTYQHHNINRVITTA